MKQQFEFKDKKSHKFWSIETKGKSNTVQFGRFGGLLQSREKSFASSSVANLEAKRLIASKIKKGYRPLDNKNAVKPKVGTNSAAAENKLAPFAANVVNGELLVLAFTKGNDIWTLLDDGGDRKVEKWMFGNKASVAKAVAFIKSTQDAKDKRALQDFIKNAELFDPKKPGVKLQGNDIRLPRFQVAKSGTLEIRKYESPKWLFHRPPMPCLDCGAPMMPVVSWRGPIDVRFGKTTLVAVSCCSNCQYEAGGCSNAEVVVQRNDEPFEASRYFVGSHRQEYRNIHLTVQTSRFGVVVHRGEVGVPGYFKTTDFKTLNAARKAFAQICDSMDEEGFEEVAVKFSAKQLSAWNEHNVVNRRLFALSEYLGKSEKLQPPKAVRLKAKQVVPAYTSSRTPSYDGGFTEAFQAGERSIGGEPSTIYAHTYPGKSPWSKEPQCFFADHVEHALWGFGSRGFVWIAPNSPFGVMNWESD